MYDTVLVEAILPLVDGVVERFRSGIDVIIDVGTGQGQAVNVLRRAFPDSCLVSVDF